jgi:phosphatidylserine synthase
MLVDLIIYGIALSLYMIHRYKFKQVANINLKGTDLSHVALAVVAANSLTVSPYGALASVILTALYVIYQWWQDKSPKDIAVYTGAFAAVIAAKFGISLVGL